MLVDITGRQFPEILRLLAELAPDLRQEGRPARAGKYTPPPGIVPLEAPQAISHRKYLRERGFDPAEIAELWGVGAICDPSIIPARGGNHATSSGGTIPVQRVISATRPASLRWRLFIPVHGVRHATLNPTLSWTTRAIGRDVEPRYLSAPPDCESIPLKDTLYGLEKVKSATTVVEGPADAWRIGPGAVATYGLSVTQSQVLLISQIPVRVICFDSDSTAQRRAHKLATILAAFPGETHVACLSGKDPADSPEEEIRELRRRYLD